MEAEVRRIDRQNKSEVPLGSPEVKCFDPTRTNLRYLTAQAVVGSISNFLQDSSGSGPSLLPPAALHLLLTLTWASFFPPNTRMMT